MPTALISAASRIVLGAHPAVEEAIAFGRWISRRDRLQFHLAKLSTMGFGAARAYGRERLTQVTRDAFWWCVPKPVHPEHMQMPHTAGEGLLPICGL